MSSMKRINHPDQLNDWKSQIIADTPRYKKTVVITSGTCGQASGSLQIIDAFFKELEARHLQEDVGIKITACHGFCEMEPNIIIQPEGIFYKRLKPEDVPEIVEKTILKDEIIPGLLYEDPSNKEKYGEQTAIPFYQKQMRLLTEKDSYKC